MGEMGEGGEGGREEEGEKEEWDWADGLGKETIKVLVMALERELRYIRSHDGYLTVM